MTTEPLDSVRDHLSDVVDRVEHQRERVMITRNGRDPEVVASPADLAGTGDTIAVRSTPEQPNQPPRTVLLTRRRARGAVERQRRANLRGQGARMGSFASPPAGRRSLG